MPLKAGDETVGALLLLDLLSTDGIQSMLEAILSLGGVMGLVFKNSIFYQRLDQEVKRRTRSLEKERDKYKITIESAIDGFWLLDTAGTLLEVNDAYCRMSGYSRDELLGMSIGDIDATETRADTKQRIEKIIRTGNDRFETRHRHKTGRLFDVEISTTYTKEGGGSFFSFIRDITEQLQMEARLRQAQRMESIGTLAGGIAHDFNNLLFPIVGMAELLKEDLPRDSMEYDNADEIYKAGIRGSELVKQILAFSRQTEQEMLPIRLHPVIKEAVKLARSSIPVNIGIHQNIRNDCGIVTADPTQIHQVAINLITNAYHAVETSGGNIDISLLEKNCTTHDLLGTHLSPGRFVVFTITDGGTGINTDILDNIFEPYFTTKEQGKGTGLGLSVVYGIIKGHKGDIKVSSQRGQGTTFTVFFPLAESSGKPTDENKKSDLPGGKERLMVVDDEESITRLQTQILERLGYQIRAYKSGQDALTAFTADPGSFDLVITDMAMADLTGDQLAKALLTIRPDIPIIVCTGYSERITPEKIEGMGVKGVLMKPVVKSELAGMIRRLLDRRAKNTNPLS